MYSKGKRTYSLKDPHRKSHDFLGEVERLVKIANEGGSALLKFLIAGGGLLTFSYCFFYIKFFPTGLTAGDTLLFLWAVMGFTFTHLILLSWVWLATGWLATLLGKLAKKNKREVESSGGNKSEAVPKPIGKYVENIVDQGIMGFFRLIALVLLIVLIGINYPQTALILAITGFLLGVLEELGKRWKQSSKANKFAYCILWIVVPIIPMLLDSTIRQREIEAVFNGLGVRSSQTSVRLSEDNFTLLSAVAQQYQVPVFPCGIEGENKERLVSGVEVLWHGIGERSLIAIPLPQDLSTMGNTKKSDSAVGTPKTVRIELERSGMYVVRSDKPSLERCLDLNSDVLFASGSDVLLSKSENEITDRVSRMLGTKDVTLKKIRVIGHADIQPVVVRGQSNFDLAMKRAERVKNIIVKTLVKDSNLVVAESKGSSEPRVQCSPSLPNRMMSECLAPNRRVEIRTEFVVAKPK